MLDPALGVQCWGEKPEEIAIELLKEVVHIQEVVDADGIGLAQLSLFLWGELTDPLQSLFFLNGGRH